MTDDGYSHPEYLVEADWLAGHLDDDNVVVVDCDVDAGYQQGPYSGRGSDSRQLREGP